MNFRSIVWLQGQRDTAVERQRNTGAVPRRDDPHEFRVGRLKHERVRVPRGERLLDWAQQVMKIHSDRKAILEVEFQDEEGTGLGPSLEFYALAAAEIQRRDLALWICDDDDLSAETPTVEGAKPPGYYVLRPSGLFPAPLPQDSPICDHAEQLFWFLGKFLIHFSGVFSQFSVDFWSIFDQFSGDFWSILSQFLIHFSVIFSRFLVNFSSIFRRILSQF